MRTRTTLTAAAFVAAGALLGWSAASEKLPQLVAHDKKADPQPAAQGS